MRAIRHHEFGPTDVLRLEQLPDPEPREGELRIRVEAAGVHLLDTSIRAGESFGAMEPPTLPMVPGREVAGVVDAVGAGVDPMLVGRRVVGHLGPASGGYAELAVVAADRAHPVPEGLEPAVAVAAIGTGRTAAGILRLADVGPDDAAVVTSAAGGLGVLLLQAARRAGARTIALAGGPAKLDIARAHGADVLVDYRNGGWDAALRERGERPTVVFDGVGGVAGRAAYDLLVPGGRLVRYGWSSGEQNDYDDPQRPVIDVLGPVMLAVPGGIAALEAEALAAAADGTRVPWVGSTFPLANAADAHAALEQRATTGKVVLLPGVDA
jgi:NADPH2:quinone reductase